MSLVHHTNAFVIGEALIDAVHAQDGIIQEHPGGSPANVALTLGRLGQAAQLLSWFGVDARGQRVAQWLSDSNVTVDPQSQQATKTSVATAKIQADGSAQYDFDIDWNIAAGAAVPANANVIHTGSIAAVLQPGGDKVYKLLEHARDFATITYDPNARPSLMGSPEHTRKTVEQYVAIADVVKVSDEDLEWLYPGQEPLDVAKTWHDQGTALVIVTKGGSGATAFASCGQVNVVTPKVTVVDTVGAGDSFMGALIFGLGQHNLLGKSGRAHLNSLDRITLDTVLDQCVRVAAVTVSRAGANPPRINEL